MATTPPHQLWLIAERSGGAVTQPGQPPSQAGAWLLDIPEGSNALGTAAKFVADKGFPIGTVAHVIDIAEPVTIETWRLDSTWAEL